MVHSRYNDQNFIKSGAHVIISRYISREVAHSMMVIVTILLLVIACNMYVHYLTVAAGGNMLSSGVIKIIGMMLPRYLSLIIPVGLFFAILIVFGRFFADNELTVIMGAGVNWWKLLRMVLPMALFSCVLVAVISCFVVPVMTGYQTVETHHATNQSNLDMIPAGRFVPLLGGKKVIYIGQVSQDRKNISHVFLYGQTGNGTPTVFISAHGEQKDAAKHGESGVFFPSAFQYQGRPDKKDFKVTQLTDMIMHLRQDNQVVKNIESQSTWQLINLHTLEAIAEIQWRLSMPLVVLVLTVLGVAMSRVRPRSSQFSRILPGLVVVLLYYNAMIYVKSLMLQSVVFSYLGLWSVHVLFLLIGIFMIDYQNGQAIKKRVKS